MKRLAFTLALLIVLIVIPACGGSTGEAAVKNEARVSEETVKTEEPAQKGEKYDSDKFSLTIPEGWEVMDVGGGVQLYKMSGEVFELHFRGYNMNEDEAMEQAASTAEQYGGTEPEEAELFGKMFWTTSFTAASIPQVTYLRIEDGVMLSVKYGGPDYKENPDFIAILESVELT